MMVRSLTFSLVALLTLTVSSAQSGKPEATSLLGQPLYSAAPSAEALKSLEANLARAKAAYDKAPDDAETIIWLGRRTAYLGRYGEAIEIFSRGVEKHPRDPRMYRHRGHRYITVRALGRAIADFSKAAELVAGRADEVEPDGQPNARNIPTSTLNSNIYYHLGLAHYLSGDFEKAAEAYRECLTFSKNPDMLSATTHWQYMTLRRLNRAAEANALLAPITPAMEIIENGSYHKLLMMYKGASTPESLLGAAPGLDAVTIGYGVANWHLYNGRRDQAAVMLREIVEKNATQWPAFGYIAAEADLARIQGKKED
jgi:tetratricopeptide (TPR) repeat protein